MTHTKCLYKEYKKQYNLVKDPNGTIPRVNKDGTITYYSIKMYKGEPVLCEEYLHTLCRGWFINTYGNFIDKQDAPILCHIANETFRGNNKGGTFQYHRKMKNLGKITGMPDLMVINNGKTFFIELKTLNGKIKPEQEYIMESLQKHGVPCFICRTLEEFKEVTKDNI